MVIDGHKQGLMARARNVLGAIPGDPMAWFVKAHELLGVQVQQFARACAFVTHNRGCILQGWQLGGPSGLAGPRNSASGQSDSLGNALVGQALVASQCHGPFPLARAAAPRAAVRPGTTVLQSGRPLTGKSLAPLVGASRAQTGGCSRQFETKSINLSHQMGSTFGR